MPMPQPGLTDKNKGFLRQFDDPAVLQRLHDLPDRLWAEVRRQPPHFRTLAKAQAALALSILCYIPLRLQNLVPLTFDVHLFVRAQANAISSLEISAPEVKNKTDMAFDIPRRTAKMLIEYRDRIVPKIIGRRSDRLFVNADGSPKSQSTVAWLIKTYARRRAGIVLTSHQFRHLSAKVLLDAEPGSFETVRQLLGHKSLKTTVGAYAGIDSRRAARHHQHLIEQALATRRPRHRLKAKPVNAERCSRCPERPACPSKRGPLRIMRYGSRHFVRRTTRSLSRGAPLTSLEKRAVRCARATAHSCVFCQSSIPSALPALHRPGSIATSPCSMSSGAVRCADLQRSRPVLIRCALRAATCALALTSHGCCRSRNAWPPRRRPNRQGFIL